MRLQSDRSKVKRHMKDAARDHLSHLCDGFREMRAGFLDFEDVYVHNDRLLEDLEYRNATLTTMFRFVFEFLELLKAC